MQVENQPEQTQTITGTEAPPMMNSPEARTATGELKDQSALTSTEQKPEVKPEVKLEAKSAVPEKYEFKAGEGGEVNQKLVELASPVFKELGLTQAQADKLSGLYNEIAKDQQTRVVQQINEMREGWRQAIASDKDMAGKQTEIGAVIGRAKEMLPPDLRAEFNKTMNETGMGDHPVIVKTLWKLSELLSEGRPVSGNGPSPHGQVSNGKIGRAHV